MIYILRMCGLLTYCKVMSRILHSFLFKLFLFYCYELSLTIVIELLHKIKNCNIMYNAVRLPSLKPIPNPLHYYSIYNLVDFTGIESNHDDTKEETVIPCILLGFRKNDVRAPHKLALYSENKGVTMPFDKLIFCGVAGSKTGICFAILSKTPDESRKLLTNFIVKGSAIVGETVYITESVFQNDFLGKDYNLPSLAVKDALIPYCFPQYRPVQIDSDSTPGVTKFFHIHSKQISLDLTSMVKMQCTGEECDRLLLQGKAKTCGCINNLINQKDLAIETDLYLNDMDDNGTTKACMFRSWQLTKLCIVIMQDFELSQFQGLLRAPFCGAVREIIRYVNTNGGWNIVGWIHRGLVIDALEHNEVNGFQVAADDVGLHIVSLTSGNKTQLLTDTIRCMRYNVHETNNVDDAKDDNNEDDGGSNNVADAKDDNNEDGGGLPLNTVAGMEDNTNGDGAEFQPDDHSDTYIQPAP